MGNKKPLRYWTLEELKRSCQENVGPHRLHEQMSL